MLFMLCRHVNTLFTVNVQNLGSSCHILPYLAFAKGLCAQNKMKTSQKKWLLQDELLSIFKMLLSMQTQPLKSGFRVPLILVCISQNELSLTPSSSWRRVCSQQLSKKVTNTNHRLNYSFSEKFWEPHRQKKAISLPAALQSFLAAGG